MIAKLNDLAVTAWARVRRRQCLRPPAGIWKLNVGSGIVVAPGWTNIDVSLSTLVAPLPRFVQRLVHQIMPASSATRRDYSADEFVEILSSHRFVHHDVRYGLPVPDGSVDFIYTSHFLEHLFLDDARARLREAHRALKPGGVLRVCVPDLDHALHLFEIGRPTDGLEFFFMGPSLSEFTRHRWMWGFHQLHAELTAAGFHTGCRRGYRVGVTPDLGILDNRPDETLYVEASK